MRGSSSGSSSSSSSSSGAEGGPQAAIPVAADSAAEEQQQQQLDCSALRSAVALSRLANHPISRALVEAAAPGLDDGVAVLAFEQVPGCGVQGVCRVDGGPPLHVRFGAGDWVDAELRRSQDGAGSGGGGTAAAALEELQSCGASGTGASRATATLVVSELRPPAADGSAAAARAPKSAGGRTQEGSGGSSSGGKQAAKPLADGSVLYTFEPARLSGRSAEQQQQQIGLQESLGTAGTVLHLSLLCFDDVIQPGVKAAVAALQSGAWRRGAWTTAATVAGEKDVVMLTGGCVI